MTHRLKYPAPRREGVPAANGWCTHPWSISGVLATIHAGGWFEGDGNHDFEPGVGPFAREAQKIWAFLHLPPQPLKG